MTYAELLHSCSANYFVPLTVGERSIVMYMCVCEYVCLSVRLSVFEHFVGTTRPNLTKTSTNFMCTLPVGPWLGLSLTALHAACYIFPVLWITQCFPVVCPMALV